MNDVTGKILALIHGVGSLITALSVFAGIVFALIAIMQLYRIGNPQSGGYGSQQGPIRGAVLSILAAVLLVDIGFTVQAAQDTLFASDGFYPQSGLPTTWETTDTFSSRNAAGLQARLVIDLFQLVGMVGLIKSIFIMRSIGSGRQEPGQMAKLAGYFFGGILVMRVESVISGLADIFPVMGAMGRFLADAA